MKKIALLFLVLLFGCKNEPHKTLTEEVKERLASIPTPIPDSLLMEHISVPVESTTFQGTALQPFLVMKRDQKINRFPCTDCHKNGKTLLNQPNPHGDVQLKHASKEVMDCATCHNTAKAMNLKTLQGNSVSFNHAYNNCKQCHSSQAKDWAGGAHGKRLKTWSGSRIVFSCTECHSPHKPAFPTRWPSITMPDMTKGKN
ncbi:MAG: hypothetical protein GY915_09275 [bacterium]|nr:hypothetical protein [bacterium]